MGGHVIVESCLRLLCRRPRPLSMRQILVGVRIAPANCCAGFILQLRPQLDRVLDFRFQEFSLGACHQSAFCVVAFFFVFGTPVPTSKNASPYLPSSYWFARLIDERSNP